MKALYDEFFRVKKGEKIREKVMLARTALSIVIMVVCMIAMSLTAYAYFSCEISSASNVIKSANFDIDVAVTEVSDTEESPQTVVLTSENHVYTATLQEGVTYRITLKHQGTAETGFCVITIPGCEEVYHTQQLGEDEMTFTLQLSDVFEEITSYEVTFMSHWGTSSYYGYIADEGANNASDLYITDKEEMQVEITGITYVVKKGDNLYSIAAKYGTTVEMIVEYNKIEDEAYIEEGQELVIPPGK